MRGALVKVRVASTRERTSFSSPLYLLLVCLCYPRRFFNRTRAHFVPSINFEASQCIGMDAKHTRHAPAPSALSSESGGEGRKGNASLRGTAKTSAETAEYASARTATPSVPGWDAAADSVASSLRSLLAESEEALAEIGAAKGRISSRVPVAAPPTPETENAHSYPYPPCPPANVLGAASGEGAVDSHLPTLAQRGWAHASEVVLATNAFPSSLAGHSAQGGAASASEAERLMGEALALLSGVVRDGHGALLRSTAPALSTPTSYAVYGGLACSGGADLASRLEADAVAIDESIRSTRRCVALCDESAARHRAAAAARIGGWAEQQQLWRDDELLLVQTLQARGVPVPALL